MSDDTTDDAPTGAGLPADGTPDPTDAPDATDEQPAPDDDGRDEGDRPVGPGNERESVAVEAAADGNVRPPSPPRRTGVFVHADDLREYVGALLRSMLGGYEADAWGNFTFQHESSRIFVTVGPSPVGPQVGVFSVTNVDVDLTPELAGFLLTTNHQLGFGSFSYDPDNRAVWLRHSLLGTTLDAPELQTAVAAIANTAHQANRAIADRFGGKTFDDASTATQQAQRPPQADDEGPDLTNPSGYL